MSDQTPTWPGQSSGGWNPGAGGQSAGPGFPPGGVQPPAGGSWSPGPTAAQPQRWSPSSAASVGYGWQAPPPPPPRRTGARIVAVAVAVLVAALVAYGVVIVTRAPTHHASKAAVVPTIPGAGPFSQWLTTTTLAPGYDANGTRGLSSAKAGPGGELAVVLPPGLGTLARPFDTPGFSHWVVVSDSGMNGGAASCLPSMVPVDSFERIYERETATGEAGWADITVRRFATAAEAKAFVADHVSAAQQACFKSGSHDDLRDIQGATSISNDEVNIAAPVGGGTALSYSANYSIGLSTSCVEYKTTYWAAVGDEALSAGYVTCSSQYAPADMQASAEAILARMRESEEG